MIAWCFPWRPGQQLPRGGGSAYRTGVKRRSTDLFTHARRPNFVTRSKDAFRRPRIRFVQRGQGQWAGVRATRWVFWECEMVVFERRFPMDLCLASFLPVESLCWDWPRLLWAPIWEVNSRTWPMSTLWTQPTFLGRALLRSIFLCGRGLYSFILFALGVRSPLSWPKVELGQGA